MHVRPKVPNCELQSCHQRFVPAVTEPAILNVTPLLAVLITASVRTEATITLARVVLKSEPTLITRCLALRLPCRVELDDQLLITFRKLRRMRSWMT